MGDRTKIDWCDASWNPVTGCLHGCEYCYARRIAQRFCNNEHGKDDAGVAYPCTGDCKFCSELDGLEFVGQKMRWNHDTRYPYPYGFFPTIHPHRLNIPEHWTKPRNIFVCSMADLCGSWVPEEWKQAVIAACKEAPQHRYMFLTKNPYGYNVWPTKEKLVVHKFDQDNFWLGCSVTGRENLSEYKNDYGRYLYAMGGNMIPGKAHRFISIEPILTDVTKSLMLNMDAFNSRYAGHIEWVIIGAETGNRKGKVIPEKEWIEDVVWMCRNNGTKVFMKESLRGLMGEDFIQEFPWEENRHDDSRG